MLRRINLVLAVLACFVGCKRPSPSVGAASASAATSIAPIASTLATRGAAGAGDVLSKQPDLLTQIPPTWQARIDGFLTGDDARACPSLANVTGKDEFELHDAKAAALKQCSSDNQKAVALMKRCPIAMRAPIDIKPYNFQTSTLSLALQPARDMLTSANSRIWWARAFLLSWPGLLPERMKPGNDLPRDARCSGGWQANMAGMSNTNIDIKLSEQDAKALKEKVGDQTAAVEVAFVLDGGAAEEPLDCDAVVPKTATGRALAWRTIGGAGGAVELLPWTTVEPFEPSGGCSDLRTLFGVTSAAEASAAAEPAADCVCSFAKEWSTVINLVPEATNIDKCTWDQRYGLADILDRIKGTFPANREKFEAFAKRIDEASECPSDRGAKKAMQSWIAEGRKAFTAWGPLLTKDYVELSDVNKANLGCRMYQRFQKSVSPGDCTGSSCNFGCK